MVTFANLGSVRLPSLKFVDLRVRKIWRIIVHVSCLSTTTVSQLFKPQLKKVVIFTYPGLHFLFALGTPLWQSRKTLHEWKRQFSTCETPRSIVPVYIQQFPSNSNRKCKKSPFSRTAGHIFVSPGDAPAIITQYVAFQCLPNPSQHVSIYLQ